VYTRCCVLSTHAYITYILIRVRVRDLTVFERRKTNKLYIFTYNTRRLILLLYLLFFFHNKNFFLPNLTDLAEDLMTQKLLVSVDKTRILRNV